MAPERREVTQVIEDSSDNSESELLFSDVKSVLRQAESLYQDVKVVAAYRLLRLCWGEKLSAEHQDIFNKGQVCEDSIQDLLNPPCSGNEDGWIRQGETRGLYPTEIYYKVDSTGRLTCRLETPIDQSLLIPLLSVLNESELYREWFPSSSSPPMGLLKSHPLVRHGRADQVLQVATAAPWPFATREVIIQTVVFDDIDCNGLFGVHLGTAPTGGAVPPPEKGVKRVSFEGMLLFRPCPPDHPMLSSTTPDSQTESKILVSFKMWCDPQMTGLPTSVLNYATRSYIGEIWNMLLEVADGVRKGKQPKLLLAVSNRPELYEFVKERVTFMLGSLNGSVEDLEGYEEEKRFLAYLQC